MFRATIKSLLSRKLRLFLSALAVILGVMFVSGAFVLTDTLGRSFDNLFAGIFANTDAQVAAKPKLAAGAFDDDDAAACDAGSSCGCLSDLGSDDIAALVVADESPRSARRRSRLADALPW